MSLELFNLPESVASQGSQQNHKYHNGLLISVTDLEGLLSIDKMLLVDNSLNNRDCILSIDANTNFCVVDSLGTRFEFLSINSGKQMFQ